MNHHIAVHMLCRGRTEVSRSRIAFEIRRIACSWYLLYTRGRHWRNVMNAQIYAHKFAVTLYTLGSP